MSCSTSPTACACASSDANTPAFPVRYFLTYRGMRLPLQLAEELNETEVRNRNTFFTARYDTQGRLTEIDKCVYGEVEMTHRYTWDEASGRLIQAVIQVGEEDPQVLTLG